MPLPRFLARFRSRRRCVALAVESMAVFSRLVELAGVGSHDEMAAALEPYLGKNPLNCERYHLLSAAAVSAVARACKRHIPAGGLVGPVLPDDADPAEVAAHQAVAAWINGDVRAAEDVHRALVNTYGHQALVDMVLTLADFAVVLRDGVPTFRPTEESP